MAAIMSQLIRIGLILAAIVLAVTAVLYLVGGSSRTYSAAIQIDAPAATVFDFLVQPEKRVRWSDRIERIEPLTDGARDPKTESRLTISNGGRTYTAVDEILEMVPAESLLTELRGPGATERSAFHLKQGSQGKTVVDYTLIYKARGIERLTIPFRGDRIAKRLTAELQHLKQQVEQGTHGSTPGGDETTRN